MAHSRGEVSPGSGKRAIDSLIASWVGRVGCRLKCKKLHCGKNTGTRTARTHGNTQRIEPNHSSKGELRFSRTTKAHTQEHEKADKQLVSVPHPRGACSCQNSAHSGKNTARSPIRKSSRAPSPHPGAPQQSPMAKGNPGRTGRGTSIKGGTDGPHGPPKAKGSGPKCTAPQRGALHSRRCT